MTQIIDPRQFGQDLLQEEIDMEGLGERAKVQQAKRDKMHASALRRNAALIRKQKEKK